MSLKICAFTFVSCEKIYQKFKTQKFPIIEIKIFILN